MYTELPKHFFNGSIGRSYIINLPIELGMASLSTMVLKFYKIEIVCTYSPNFHKLNWYNVGLFFFYWSEMKCYTASVAPIWR